MRISFHWFQSKQRGHPLSDGKFCEYRICIYTSIQFRTFVKQFHSQCRFIVFDPGVFPVCVSEYSVLSLRAVPAIREKQKQKQKQNKTGTTAEVSCPLASLFGPCSPLESLRTSRCSLSLLLKTAGFGGLSGERFNELQKLLFYPQHEALSRKCV